MNKESLARIIQLVELDQRIAQIGKGLTDSTTKEAQLTKEIAHIDQEVSAAQKVLHDTKKKIDALELEMKVVQDNIEKTKEKLLMASSEKELSSLQSEHRSLEKRRSALDEEGFVVLTDLENVQEKAAALLAQKPEKLGAKQKELDELSQRQTQNAQLLDTLTNERDELLPQVPDEFREQYESMKQRVPNPVVPIVKEGCYGCFYGVSKPELIKAQQGSLVTCQGCYRMLYTMNALKNNEHKDEQVEQ